MSVRPNQSKPLPAISNGVGTKNSKSMKKQNKKQKKTKRRVKQLAGTQPLVRAERFYLSPCTYKYLKALCNPFANVSGVCIPDLIDRPSMKIITWERGAFTVGSGQVGYVGTCVQCVTNSNPCTISSRPAPAAPTTISALAGDAVTTFNTQFPYALGNLGSGYRARVVATGIRARYMGTELSRSGRIIAGRLSSVQTFGGFTPADILSAHNEIMSCPCDREWHEVSYIPMQMEDFNYTNATQQINAVAAPSNVDLLIAVEGAAVGNTFEWEIVRYFELIQGDTSPPSLTLNNLTPSHSDVPGVSAVRGFFEGTVPQDDGPSLFKQALDWVGTFTPEDVSHFVSGVSKIARAYEL